MIKYNIDEDYFKIIDTEDKAYFLGFIYADGCICKASKKQYTFALKLAEQDKYILDTFKHYLKSNSIIIKTLRNDGQNQFRLSVYNQTFIKNLMNQGVNEKKTFNCIFPKNISCHLIHHFMRGYFDGDGSILVKKPCFSVIGTKEFICAYKDILLERCVDLMPKFTITEKPDTYYIISKKGVYNTISIRDFLYKDATIYLQRKYDRFFSLLPKRNKYQFNFNSTSY